MQKAVAFLESDKVKLVCLHEQAGSSVAPLRQLRGSTQRIKPEHRRFARRSGLRLFSWALIPHRRRFDFLWLSEDDGSVRISQDLIHNRRK